MLEYTITLHWLIEVGDDAVDALMSEHQRALKVASEKADLGLELPEDAIREILDVDVPKVAEQDTLRRFERVCEELGVAHNLYIVYRVECAAAHPTLAAASVYLVERPDKGIPPSTASFQELVARSSLRNMQLANVQAGTGTLGVRTLVLTADKFEDLELIVPYFRLLEEGGAVDIAAPTMEEISGEHGYRVMPDLLITDADADHYGLLLVPGGFPDGAPATVRDIPEAQEIARSFFTSGKPVAAICHGPWLLAAAGVVSGRRLTSYWQDGVPEDVRAAGGKWEDAPVVVDGNLVTSRWPPDIPMFTSEMMRLVRAPQGL